MGGDPPTELKPPRVADVNPEGPSACPITPIQRERIIIVFAAAWDGRKLLWWENASIRPDRLADAFPFIRLTVLATRSCGRLDQRHRQSSMLKTQVTSIPQSRNCRAVENMTCCLRPTPLPPPPAPFRGRWIDNGRTRTRKIPKQRTVRLFLKRQQQSQVGNCSIVLDCGIGAQAPSN